MWILVVEDEALIAFAVEWALKMAGHDVLGPADSVEAAIAVCEESRPDIALIDLNLRDGGDGVEVAKYLHERHQTLCLFLSAQVAHARANQDIAWGLIRKPYDFAALPAMMNYTHELGRGGRPGKPPLGLEIFQPANS